MKNYLSRVGRGMAIGGVALAMAVPAAAASLAFTLDQSNPLPDGTGYANVTISELDGGVIQFVVQLLNPLESHATKKFGLDRFGFNVDGISIKAKDIQGLPKGWVARTDKRLNKFGWFDIVLFGKPNARTDTLTFTIDVDGDSPTDYASVFGNPRKGTDALFGASVAGFKITNGKRRVTTADFAGMTEAVPLPATLSLFVAAMGSALWRARSRRRR